MKHKIILFDGVCNLCNGFVQFIIKRDHNAIFKFAALQSDFGQAFLKSKNLNPLELKSVILIDDETVYTQSNAALRILKHLDGAWKLGYTLIIVPPFIRNSLYKIIAKYRYKWFGKKNQCMVPTAELSARFL
jgi:predicted DCC family thiol-disulfide oxidoreductase YuxK